MKLVDLDAGSRPDKLPRRRFLQGSLASLCLSAFGAMAAEPAVIVHSRDYMGGRILRQATPTGMPDFRTDAIGAMTFFVSPVGVAVTPLDIYVADAGLSALFRYDPTLDAMAVVAGVRVTEQTRIAAVQDGSVVVSDVHRGVPRRFSRGGRQLQTIAPDNTGGRFDDIAIDYQTGGFIGLDRIQRRLEEVHPLGRSATVLPEELLPRLPTAMALDNTMLYVAGQDCQCIVTIDLTRRDRQVLVEDLEQVTALVAGDGWLVVSDNVERVLRIYRDRVLRADPDYDLLRLVNPQGMSISRGILYVADAGGRRIASYRLRP